MGLREMWGKFQERRAERFLNAHANTALTVLRRNPEIGARALEAVYQIDAARKGKMAERETYEYPVLIGTPYGAKTPVLRTYAKPVPAQIRAFAQYPPSRRAINALSNPILDLPFEIVVRKPLGMDKHDEPPKPTAEQQQRIVNATEMFICPNNEQDGREFLEMILEDLITMGGGVFEVEDNKSDNRPLFMWPVDAQSIRINLQWQPGSDDYHYSQGKGYLFGSVGTTDEVKLMDDQLCYAKLNPRTSNPFGYGYLEVAFDSVNAYAGAFAYAQRRASNNTPNYALFLGENVTAEHTRRFQNYWESEIEGYGKIPILGGGRSPAVLNFSSSNEDALFLQWQEWVVRIIAMSFGLSPMRLGLERDVNKSTAAQGSADDFATIAPVANTIKNAFTHWLLWKRLGWQDLEFTFQIKTSDELKQAEILSLQYNAEAITIDELRQIYDRPALPDGLGNFTKTAYVAAIQSAASSTTGANPSVNGAPPTPFDDQSQESWSPDQAAFVRKMMTNERLSRHGIGMEVNGG